MIQVKHYIVTYNPTEDGDRDILSEEEHVISFDDLDEVYDKMIIERGIYEYSSTEYQPHMWYASETYTDPYTGVCRDETMRRGEGVTDEEWRQLWDMAEEG